MKNQYVRMAFEGRIVLGMRGANGMWFIIDGDRFLLCRA